MSFRPFSDRFSKSSLLHRLFGRLIGKPPRPAAVPRIEISPLAMQKMRRYVDLCPTEIGWLGFVAPPPRGGAVYSLTDVILLRQGVSAATTEIDPVALAEAVSEILQRPDGMEAAESLLFWGHSHVHMGVFASGQDNAQMNDFQKNGAPFMIRAILNKRGDAKFDLFDYTTGAVHLNVSWSVPAGTAGADTALDVAIGAEIAAKTRPIGLPGFSWQA